MSGRAVITGLGVVAPSGMDVDEHWAAVTGGRRAIDRIDLFDPTPYATTLAGQVRGFTAEDHVEGRLLVQTDRWTWMAFAAARQAIHSSGVDLSTVDRYRLSVVMASSSGGNQFGQKELQRLWSHHSRTVGAYQSIAWFYAATVGQLSIRHQAKGQSSVLVAEAAGGLDSIAHAARGIARGDTDVALAGGLEAPLSPYALSCQQRSGWLSTETDPDLAYLPFDERATGFVPGEGGAVLVVEDLDHATARGADVLGEVVGWGSTHDAEHTRRTSSGSAHHYARAMRQALDRAGLTPDDVDLVIPDALGVPAYDRTEVEAIRAVFGARPVPVTSQKSLVGRMYQGGSALDVVSALLTMRTGVVAAFAGLGRPGEGRDLAFVTTTGPLDAEVVLIGARGFDGFNSALVVRRYRAPEQQEEA